MLIESVARALTAQTFVPDVVQVFLHTEHGLAEHLNHPQIEGLRLAQVIPTYRMNRSMSFEASRTEVLFNWLTFGSVPLPDRVMKDPDRAMLEQASLKARNIYKLATALAHTGVNLVVDVDADESEGTARAVLVHSDLAIVINGLVRLVNKSGKITTVDPGVIADYRAHAEEFLFSKPLNNQPSDGTRALALA